MCFFLSFGLSFSSFFVEAAGANRRRHDRRPFSHYGHCSPSKLEDFVVLFFWRGLFFDDSVSSVVPVIVKTVPLAKSENSSEISIFVVI